MKFDVNIFDISISKFDVNIFDIPISQVEMEQLLAILEDENIRYTITPSCMTPPPSDEGSWHSIAPEDYERDER